MLYNIYSIHNFEAVYVLNLQLFHMLKITTFLE